MIEYFIDTSFNETNWTSAKEYNTTATEAPI